VQSEKVRHWASMRGSVEIEVEVEVDSKEGSKGPILTRLVLSEISFCSFPITFKPRPDLTLAHRDENN
jgi:hypothetical protein